MRDKRDIILPKKVKTIIKKYNNHFKEIVNSSVKINLEGEIKKRNRQTFKEFYSEFENQYEMLCLGIKMSIVQSFSRGCCILGS